ncbi:MAG: sugar ABC transporter permease [Elusimicrobia bacterium]|nr:sugar ABC transporter permease [Candidatus Liberimonas magnetica]
MEKIIKNLEDFFNKETVVGYCFILPNFIGFLIFTSLPIVASMILSFTEWDIFSAPKFIGLENYFHLFWFHVRHGMTFSSWFDYIAVWRYIEANDPDFWYFLYNTVFMMIGIPLGMIGSLFLAIIMNRALRGIYFFRTIYFLPTVSSAVAIALLWRWIYNPDYGMLNTMLASIGIIGPPWLNHPVWAKISLIIMGLWTSIGGYSMLLYLAALQGIPQHLYEAADIDGANFWQKFRHITVPLISPTTFFIFIMGVISGFQGGFQNAYLMTRGGPAQATTTIEYYIYNNAFVWFHMGKASALAWFLFLIIFVVTLFNWKYGGKKVTYTYI